jgi:putative sugar O-methyltransferase
LNFRRDPEYATILSGSDYQIGKISLKNIKKINSFNLLLEKINEVKDNDKVGNPILQNYDELGDIDPSTLAYFNHAIEILKIIDIYKPRKILEIGGGYGGLCRILSIFIKFDEYIIVDLPDVLKISQKYLSHFPKLANKVKFVSYENYENILNFSKDSHIDLLIAVSSISECAREIQNKYIRDFCLNSKYIFTVWNTLHILNGISDRNNFYAFLKKTHKKIVRRRSLFIDVIYCRRNDIENNLKNFVRMQIIDLIPRGFFDYIFYFLRKLYRTLN